MAWVHLSDLPGMEEKALKRLTDHERRLLMWTKTLNKKQMRTILLELVEFAICAEEVSFWDDTLSPYWSATGEPLIEGQQTHSDQEDGLEP